MTGIEIATEIEIEDIHEMIRRTKIEAVQEVDPDLDLEIEIEETEIEKEVKEIGKETGEIGKEIEIGEGTEIGDNI